MFRSLLQFKIRFNFKDKNITYSLDQLQELIHLFKNKNCNYSYIYNWSNFKIGDIVYTSSDTKTGFNDFIIESLTDDEVILSD